MRLSALLLCVASVLCAQKAGKTGDASLEMRWFYRGEVPGAVRQWFTQESKLGPALTDKDREERTDLYLVASGDDATGIKLRGSELELKARRSAKEVAFAGGRMSGRAEVWAKWDWSIGKASLDSKKVKGLRYDVGKERLQRKFHAGGAGCLAEVTSLTAAGGKWWSLAVELARPLDVGTIEHCAEEALQDYPGPALDLAHAGSYPSWLAGLGQN